MPSSNFQRRFGSTSIALAIVAVMSASGCARAVGPAAAPRPAAMARAKQVVAPLYPLTAGLRWDYTLRQRQADGTIKERPMHMGVAKAAPTADGVEATLERGYQGWAPPATRAIATADRVVLNRAADPAPPEGPSLTILRLPATAGQRWPGRPLSGGHAETVVVRGEEAVTVPAGSFKAVHVDHELRYANGDGDVLSYWYAPGMGCVRMIERTTIYMGDQPVKLEVEGVLDRLVPGGWPLPATATLAPRARFQAAEGRLATFVEN